MANIDSNLKLDPSVIQNKSQTYTSLTDVNGISVFSNDYQNKVKTYNLNEKTAFTNIKKEVFIKEITKDDIQLNALKSQIFLNTNNQIIQETALSNSNNPISILPIIGIAIVIFLVLITKYVQKRKENRRKYEADNYNYDSE